jgi:hypothetical protein
MQFELDHTEERQEEEGCPHSSGALCVSEPTCPSPIYWKHRSVTDEVDCWMPSCWWMLVGCVGGWRVLVPSEEHGRPLHY